MTRHLLRAGILGCVALLAPLVWTAEPGTAEPTPAERGEKALLGRHFNPPTISISAYQNAWRHWDQDLKEQPARYDEAFRERYGFHAAPYPNHGYPMGLREAPTLFLG